MRQGTGCEKNIMARPTKITKEKLAEIEQLASEGLSLQSIEAFVDLSDGLLRRYWGKGENQQGIGLKVFHAIKKGRAKLERELLEAIRTLALGKKLKGSEKTPQMVAAARLLEALHIWDNHYNVKVEKFDVPFDQIPEADQQRLVKKAIKSITGIDIK